MSEGHPLLLNLKYFQNRTRSYAYGGALYCVQSGCCQGIFPLTKLPFILPATKTLEVYIHYVDNVGTHVDQIQFKAHIMAFSVLLSDARWPNKSPR